MEVEWRLRTTRGKNALTAFPNDRVLKHPACKVHLHVSRVIMARMPQTASSRGAEWRSMSPENQAAHVCPMVVSGIASNPSYSDVGHKEQLLRCE